ncbi:MAG: hypothetical protein HZB22_03675 [Deltaproteobacteria bacterium]|nr:hypothetical protein [Deltaproteobacteria bacterium]
MTKKIVLERIRPERSVTRRLAVGETTTIIISLSPGDKSVLQKEARKRSLSLSLYMNLILLKIGFSNNCEVGCQ